MDLSIVVLTEHIIHTELVVTKDALFCVAQGVIFSVHYFTLNSVL